MVDPDAVLTAPDAVYDALRHDLPTRVARVFIPYGPLDAPGKVLVHSGRTGKELYRLPR